MNEGALAARLVHPQIPYKIYVTALRPIPVIRDSSACLFQFVTASWVRELLRLGRDSQAVRILILSGTLRAGLGEMRWGSSRNLGNHAGQDVVSGFVDSCGNLDFLRPARDQQLEIVGHRADRRRSAARFADRNIVILPVGIAGVDANFSRIVFRNGRGQLLRRFFGATGKQKCKAHGDSAKLA